MKKQSELDKVLRTHRDPYLEPTDQEILERKLAIIHEERAKHFPEAKFREILKEVKEKRNDRQ